MRTERYRILTALEVPFSFWRTHGAILCRGQVVQFSKNEKSGKLQWKILDDTAENAIPPAFDLLAALCISDRIVLPGPSTADEGARVLPLRKPG